MANKKISQLPSGAPVLTTDMLPIERGSGVSAFNFKLNIQSILTLISNYIFPTLSAISTTVSTVFNTTTVTASNDLTIGGTLSAKGTTVHHGAVTNSGNVTTAGNTTVDGAAVFNGTTTTNTQLTVNGNTTYNTDASVIFYNNLLTGSLATTTVNGSFATQGITTLPNGALLASSPSDSDNSNKIATTQYVKNNLVGVGENWVQYTFPNSDRVCGITYYNLGSKPLIVSVNSSIDTAGYGGNAFLYTDSASDPGNCNILISATEQNYGYYNFNGLQVYGVIPPGRAYRVQSDLVRPAIGGNYPNTYSYWAEFS